MITDWCLPSQMILLQPSERYLSFTLSLKKEILGVSYTFNIPFETSVSVPDFRAYFREYNDYCDTAASYWSIPVIPYCWPKKYSSTIILEILVAYTIIWSSHLPKKKWHYSTGWITIIFFTTYSLEMWFLAATLGEFCWNTQLPPQVRWSFFLPLKYSWAFLKTAPFSQFQIRNGEWGNALTIWTWNWAILDHEYII